MLDYLSLIYIKNNILYKSLLKIIIYFVFVGDPNNKEEIQAFKNLVYLYGELIKHNVFSYEHYINTLVTKGALTPGNNKTACFCLR